MQNTSDSAKSLYPHLSVGHAGFSFKHIGRLSAPEGYSMLVVHLASLGCKKPCHGIRSICKQNATDSAECTAGGPEMHSLLCTAAWLLEHGNFEASPSNGQQLRRACLDQNYLPFTANLGSFLALRCRRSHRSSLDTLGGQTGHMCQTGPQI